MANDAEPYITAVADACHAAGLSVVDYWSDDIDPRDGGIHLLRRPGADPDNWEDTCGIYWDEARGWMYGEPRNSGGELHNLLWFGDGALPAPAETAEQARRLISGEMPADERRRLIDPTSWRDHEDEDPEFEAALAAYRDAGTAATAGEEQGR